MLVSMFKIHYFQLFTAKNILKIAKEKLVEIH